MLSDALWHPLDVDKLRESALLQPAVAEIRPKARFPIDLPFRYNAGGKRRFSGAGRVVNISSTDVTVACRHQLKPGVPVELVIEWPARLDGRIPINLVMLGRVLRADSSGFSVGSCQHRFQLVRNPASNVRSELPASPDRANSVAGDALLAASDGSMPCAPRVSPAMVRRLPAMETRSAQPL